MAKKRENISSKDTKSRLDFGEYIASHIQSQILLADRKAAWIFSVLAVGTGAVLTKIIGIEWDVVNTNLIMGLIIFTLALIILAFTQTIMVIYPRIGKGTKKGLSYFEDIIQSKKSQYVSKGSKLSETEIVDALYNEAYNLANIASRKFKTLHRAIILTVIALIATIFLLLIII